MREAACFVSLFSTLLWALMSGYTPVEVLWSMQVINVPIIVVGKVSTFKKKMGLISSAFIKNTGMSKVYFV